MDEKVVKLEIKYVAKESGAVEIKTLQCNEEELAAASDYFKVQFSGRFANREIYHIDLTSMVYPLSYRCVDFTFSYITRCVPPRKRYADSVDIKIIFKTDNLPQDKYLYVYDDVFIENVGIKNFYGIMQLASYFMIRGLVDSLCTSVQRFATYVTHLNNVPVHEELQSNGLLRMKMKTFITPEIICDKNAILAHFVETKRTILQDEIFDDILSVYIFFAMIKKLHLFDHIITQIDSVIIFDVVASINKVSVEIYHTFLRKIRSITSFCNPTFKLFDHSSLLSYESHTIVGALKQTPEKMMQLVRTRSNFDAVLKSRTKDLFDNFDWTDVVIVGEFLYDILNDTNDAYTIDLMCKIDAADKINNHFEKFAPIRIFKASAEIIIKSLNLHVRLFPMDLSPFVAVHYFEFAHSMIYYDGTNVFTTVPGLTSIKYGITFHINEQTNAASVMYKGTHEKGELAPALVKKVLAGLDMTECASVLASLYPNHNVCIAPQTVTYDAKLRRFVLSDIKEVREGYNLCRLDGPNKYVKRYKLMFCGTLHKINIRKPDILRLSDQRMIILLKKETVLELLKINNFVIETLRTGKKKFIWSCIFTVDPTKESGKKGQRQNDYQHVYDPNAKYYMTIDIKSCNPHVRRRFSDGNTEIECYAVVHDCGSTRGVRFYLSGVK